jgi:hypothetical protein
MTLAEVGNPGLRGGRRGGKKKTSQFDATGFVEYSASSLTFFHFSATHARACVAMANSTQQTAFSPSSYTINLLDLPLEILREIVQYDTTEVSSITCKLLRGAYLARPCRIELDLTAAQGMPIQHVIPSMSRYPADTYPWRVDIRLRQATCKHVLPVLEQQIKRQRHVR